MKKVFAILLALMLVAPMAVPAYAVTPALKVPNLPEIPDITDSVWENVTIHLPDNLWDDWFAKHPIIIKLPFGFD